MNHVFSARPRFALGISGLGSVLLLSGCLQTTGVDAIDGLASQASELMQAQSGGSGSLSSGEIGAGLKEALRIGADKVVAQVGQSNGFNADNNIRIPLPQTLQDIQQKAAKFGLDGEFNRLQDRLNAAAEVAAPQAKSLFMDAIQTMSIEDARAILQGPDNAATQYFQGKMSGPLAQAMQPIVNDSIAQVGALETYNGLRRQLGPIAPDLQADLSNHVVDQGMSGIFYYLAQEEAAIRQDPLKRSTELLQKVFGAQ